MDYGGYGGYEGKGGGKMGPGKGGYSLMDAWRDYGAQYMYEKGKGTAWKGGYDKGGGYGGYDSYDGYDGYDGYDKGGYGKGSYDKGGYDKGGWYGYGKGDDFGKGMDNGWSSQGDWGKGDWPPIKADTGKGKGKRSAKSDGKGPADAGAEISEKIFVGSLPKSANSAEIGLHFEQFGAVKDVTLKYDQNSESRGFGFVTFESVESARQVVENYNENLFNGKWIDCKPAVPEDEKGKGKGKGGKSAPDPITDADTPVTEKLFVGSLPSTATEEVVKHYFSQYGSIASIEMKYTGDGSFRGFCFITFETVEDAQLVLDCADTILFEGKPVDCKPAAEDPRNRSSAKGAKGKGKDAKGKGKDLAEKSIIVECLPMHATEKSVWKCFENQFGNVTGVTLENDEMQTAYVGHVSFLLQESAKKVLKRYSDDEFNPIDFDGYMLDCKAAETKGKGGGKGSNSPVTEKIFVGNLGANTSQEEVQRNFSRYGSVTEVFMKSEKGKFKGYAYVTFDDVESARRALEAGNVFGEVRPFAMNTGGVKVDNPPPTTNVLKVTGLPTDPRSRDVFRFFYNFSVTRIRDTGDEIFIEFASESECKRAFSAKLGQKLGAHFAELSGGTIEEMQQAGAMQTQMAEQQKGKDGGKGDQGDYGPMTVFQTPWGPY